MTYFEKQEKERIQERNKNLLSCLAFILIVAFSCIAESALGLNI